MFGKRSRSIHVNEQVSLPLTGSRYVSCTVAWFTRPLRCRAAVRITDKSKPKHGNYNKIVLYRLYEVCFCNLDMLYPGKNVTLIVEDIR